jgi:hypothetical protein
MNTEPLHFRIAKPRGRRQVFIAASVILVCAVTWIFRPHWHADQTRVDPRLRALSKPYRMVYSTVNFDGGSIGILITDANGRSEAFEIPCQEGWRSVYVRSEPYVPGDKLPVSDHPATMQELSAILADHCDDGLDYRNLEVMTGRLGDRLQTKLFELRQSIAEWWRETRF